MLILLYSLVFFFGAISASFFNAWAERTIAQKPIFGARSACPRCGQRIKFFDLAPVFSWLVLRGRCRACGQKIAGQYFWTEIILGLIFVLIAFHFDLVGTGAGFELAMFWPAFFAWVLAAVLLAIFIVDLKKFIIPNKFLWLLLATAVVSWVVLFALKLIDGQFIINRVLAGLLFFVLFALIFFISGGRWLGFGDVKYFLLSGFLLSFAGFFLMIMLASLTGSLVGIGQILFAGKNLKSKLPFGVFLAPATLVAYLWGGQWLDYIFKLYLYL